MPKHYVGRAGRHCEFYQQLMGSVRSNYLCTGGQFWKPCADYEFCLLREAREKQGKTDKPKKRRGRRPRLIDLDEEIDQSHA